MRLPGAAAHAERACLCHGMSWNVSKKCALYSRSAPQDVSYFNKTPDSERYKAGLNEQGDFHVVSHNNHDTKDFCEVCLSSRSTKQFQHCDMEKKC